MPDSSSSSAGSLTDKSSLKIQKILMCEPHFNASHWFCQSCVSCCPLTRPINVIYVSWSCVHSAEDIQYICMLLIFFCWLVCFSTHSCLSGTFLPPPLFFLQPCLMQALGLEWYLGMVLVQGTQQWSLFLPRRTQKIQTEHNVVLCCAAMMSFLCTHPAVETHTPDRPRLQQKCKY